MGVSQPTKSKKISELNTPPTWIDLKGRTYCKIAQHNSFGIRHSRAWESSKAPINKLRTLRISPDFILAMSRLSGPKGRRTSRVVGITPDESYIQRGRRPSGLPHQIRKELNRLFSSDPRYILTLLEKSFEFKPTRNLTKINLILPDLSVAMNELYQNMVELNPLIEHHPAFARMWLPSVSRLLEIKSLYGKINQNDEM
jgi:hypothetical protein